MLMVPCTGKSFSTTDLYAQAVPPCSRGSGHAPDPIMPFVQITWLPKARSPIMPFAQITWLPSGLPQRGGAPAGRRRGDQGDLRRQVLRHEPRQRRRARVPARRNDFFRLRTAPRLVAQSRCASERRPGDRVAGFGESTDAFPQPKGYSVRDPRRAALLAPPTLLPRARRKTRRCRPTRRPARASASAPTTPSRSRRKRAFEPGSSIPR